MRNILWKLFFLWLISTFYCYMHRTIAFFQIQIRGLQIKVWFFSIWWKKTKKISSKIIEWAWKTPSYFSLKVLLPYSMLSNITFLQHLRHFFNQLINPISSPRACAEDFVLGLFFLLAKTIWVSFGIRISFNPLKVPFFYRYWSSR